MKKILVLAIMAFFLSCGSSWANIKQIKAYKEAFPDLEKPKCIACHVSEKPKKDGDHELNVYGKKVMTTAETPTAEDYKKAGSVPSETA